MQQDRTSRRQAIRWLGGAPFLYWRGVARADDLPLHTTGIEHFGFTVPDPEATARFYGRHFRWAVVSGKGPAAEILRQTGRRIPRVRRKCRPLSPSIDHFCALVEDYQPQEMRKSLEAAGVTMWPGPFGMAAGSGRSAAAVVARARRLGEDHHSGVPAFTRRRAF